ncbi:MAG: 3-isopropylmalate dehydratase, partial [Hyphomicrobiales bacterium]
EVRPGDLVVAGRNFGMGSSREQGAEALKVLGVSAVIASSFAGIFYRNSINVGLPVLIADVPDRIGDGAQASVDVRSGRLTVGTDGEIVQCEPLPGQLLAILDDGGLVPHLEKRFQRRTEPA